MLESTPWLDARSPARSHPSAPAQDSVKNTAHAVWLVVPSTNYAAALHHSALRIGGVRAGAGTSICNPFRDVVSRLLRHPLFSLASPAAVIVTSHSSARFSAHSFLDFGTLAGRTSQYIKNS